MRKRKWTQEQVDELRSIFADRAHPPVKVIAQRYGMTKGSLLGLLHRNGIKVLNRVPRGAYHKPFPMDRVPELRAFVEAGVWMPYYRILETFGCTKKGLDHQLEAMGLELPKPIPNTRRDGRNKVFINGPTRRRQAHRFNRREADRLIAEAIRAGRVTRCPPGVAQGVGHTSYDLILA